MKLAPVWQQQAYGYRILFFPRYSIELYREKDGWRTAFIDEPGVYDTDTPLPFSEALERVLAFAKEWGISDDDIQYVLQTAPGRDE